MKWREALCPSRRPIRFGVFLCASFCCYITVVSLLMLLKCSGADSHAKRWMDTHRHTHSHTHTHTHARTHARTHIHTHIHALTHLHTHKQIHIQTHSHTCTHLMPKHIHTHTHTHTHGHTHRHQALTHHTMPPMKCLCAECVSYAIQL